MIPSRYVKICGITHNDQAQAIAEMGVQALGFILVPDSPRYLPPDQIKSIVAQLPDHLDKIGVFKDLPLSTLVEICQYTGLTAVQLHGQETVADCIQLAQLVPHLTRIKAFRLRQLSDLETIPEYLDSVDKILLDAYHPHQAGGTGRTLDWTLLETINWPIPWLLAGGLRPENIHQALTLTDPDGIDVSSGVEVSPGQKDLNRVQLLLDQLYAFESSRP